MNLTSTHTKTPTTHKHCVDNETAAHPLDLELDNIFLQQCTVQCRDCIAWVDIGTRNSSGDEIANVNFLYDDIVHALQNTIDSCIPPQIDAAVMCGTKFSEITQCNGHYAVQGHSRSPILVPIERSYTTSY